MASERMRSRCRERIGRLRDASLGSEELRREAVAELQRAVGFNRWGLQIGDPDSLLPINAVCRIDFEAELPRLLMLEQTGDVNSRHVLGRSRYTSVALSASTGGNLARSAGWDECLRPYGIGDLMVAACRDAHGCWGWVNLMRDSDDPPFSSADVRLLHDVGADLGRALRRAAGRSSESTHEDPDHPGVVILDERLRPASWTPPARAWIESLDPVGRRGAMVPLALYALAGRVMAGPAAPASRLPARVRFRTPAGRWAVADAATLEGSDTRQVAITIRAAGAAEAVELHCMAHGLTVRERELVSLVVTGLSTRQLADELSISPYTVKDHLKAVFDKTGVRSRGELVADIVARAPVGAAA